MKTTKPGRPFHSLLAGALSALALVPASAGAQDLKDLLRQIAEQAARQPRHHDEPHYSDGSGSGFYPYTAPPSGGDARSRLQHAYDVGYQVGQDDFHHHLDKHFTRHPDLFDTDTHDAFAMGYGAGFDAARAWSQREDRPYHPPVASRDPVKSDRYPSGYYPYAPPPSGQPPASRNQHAYDVGHRVGQDDFLHGHEKHFTHHPDLFDEETKVSFARGYDDGFDRARDRRRAEEAARARAEAGHAHFPHQTTLQKMNGGVDIVRDGKVITHLRSAQPNVEKAGFINDGRLAVVKSRGDAGPATVQLFDVRSGTLRDTVMAFAIRDGRPSWAQGYQD